MHPSIALPDAVLVVYDVRPMTQMQALLQGLFDAPCGEQGVGQARRALGLARVRSVRLFQRPSRASWLRASLWLFTLFSASRRGVVCGLREALFPADHVLLALQSVLLEAIGAFHVGAACSGQ